MKRESGFTLIELAIVLVIIGLLLGGVLKGQELINSAKAKNMANDFKNIQIQIYSYQDKFRALPGDDKAASTNLGVDAATNGNGDGVVGGAWNMDSGEAFNLWLHLRKAGLATGSTNTADANFTPKNTGGGRIGVQSNPNNTIAGLSGSYAICSEGILGKFAKQLDASLDDGDVATGNLMSAASVNGTTAAVPISSSAISDSIKYTVCMAF